MDEIQGGEAILAQLPERARSRGDSRRGEIEIDPSCGGAELLYEDRYVALLRDAVIFPDGRKGKYLRLVEKSSFGDGIAGVVVVPRVGESLVLVRTYRHPTRSWEIEFPRGFCDAGSTPEENARREGFEELGKELGRVELLGKVKTNSGLSSSEVLVYLAELDEAPEGVGQEAAKEAIERYVVVPRDELVAMVRKGEIEDAFTLAALALYSASGSDVV